MASKKKKKTTTTRRTSKKTARRGSSKVSSATPDASGKHLVIVESPAKARTINQYLGPDFVVQASVGHVRDLPSKAPKGSKQPVPGVDLEHGFEPTYEVLPDKKKVVTELKKAAKQAADVWFATDLDREGEAIAWHLAQVLGVDPERSKRVVFNAITRAEIERAFERPHPIDLYKVYAQQARRILDRIVGYQVSPLLWKKVARGTSAGRVQSVAVRLIVEREREIEGFVPDESWSVEARMALDPSRVAELTRAWAALEARRDDRGREPSQRERNRWLGEHEAMRADLVELEGRKFELGCDAGDPRDLTADVRRVADLVGLTDVEVSSVPDPEGRGPASVRRTVGGRVADGVRYRVRSIETKQTTSRPNAPFITSTLQMAASTALGLSAQRTMRLAQSLYEGVNIRGQGQVGLITYMRTDSTHISPEAIGQARDHIGRAYGKAYLPDKPNHYGSSNKDAQEAHEAIRPTDVARHPDELAGRIEDAQLKLYRLIWTRFVASQMTPARWDSTAIMLERSDRDTGAVFRSTGRVLVFDGFYRVAGVPTSADEQNLPALEEGRDLAPFSIEPAQQFTSAPPRYSEASLVKKLESEGIGRPSTYAAIIQVIQDRNYVEQIERRFHATDLGTMVTDKLVEAFPKLLDVGYTRAMEGELDKIEEQHHDWVAMLDAFYDGFSEALETAHQTMVHAKAETQSAPYACPKCGSRTCYRFGKNGRFLSCTTYPDCDYAAPIDRQGRPQLPEQVDLLCPIDGSAMVLRSGRFGKFLASISYPEVKFVVNLDRQGRIKYPSRPPYVTDLECEKCGAALNLRSGKRGPWLGCSKFPKCRGRLAWSKVEDEKKKELEIALEKHEAAHPMIELTRRDGTPVPEGTPVSDLVLPGAAARLEVHPDADAATEAA